MKHLPLLALLCLGLMFTAGCYVGDGLPSSYSPNGVNCSQNSAPAIGRSEFNSFADWLLESRGF